jgi:hypothetical protein
VTGYCRLYDVELADWQVVKRGCLDPEKQAKYHRTSCVHFELTNGEAGERQDGLRAEG